MKHGHAGSLSTYLIILFSPLCAHAAPVNGDAPFLRQQQREQQQQQKNELHRDVRIAMPEHARPEPASSQQETPCFPIDRIALIGEDTKPFQFALKKVTSSKSGFLGKCLGIGSINQIVSIVQNDIITAGFVTTRVVVDSQDLTTRQLQIRVVPGKAGSVSFDTEDPQYQPGRVVLFNAMPVAHDDVINVRDIEQGLENLKRAPTADANIQLVPSVQPGYTDLKVKYHQRLPFRGSVSLDDAGSKSTGKYQASGTFSYDNMLTLNDLFYVTYSSDVGGHQLPGDRGSRSHNYYYSIPWGYWQLSANVSDYDYHQTVQGANQNYIYAGHSDNTEFTLSRVLYRNTDSKLTGSFSTFLRNSQNYIDDTEVEVQRRRVAGWTSGLAYRRYLADAVWDLSVNYKQGTGLWNSLPAPEEDYGEGTSHPEILSVQTSLNLPFTLAEHAFYWQPEFRAQQNFRNLTSQDRFSIGSRYTVRGFDGENMLSGDRGLLVRNDIGMQLRQSSHYLYLGTDYGLINGDSTALLIGRSLAGAVLGIKGNVFQVNYDLFAGSPLYKPDGFNTSSAVAGFNLSYSF